jgi:hypothetical protein
MFMHFNLQHHQASALALANATLTPGVTGGGHGG